MSRRRVTPLRKRIGRIEATLRNLRRDLDPQRDGAFAHALIEHLESTNQRIEDLRADVLGLRARIAEWEPGMASATAQAGADACAQDGHVWIEAWGASVHGLCARCGARRQEAA